MPGQKWPLQNVLSIDVKPLRLKQSHLHPEKAGSTGRVKGELNSRQPCGGGGTETERRRFKKASQVRSLSCTLFRLLSEALRSHMRKEGQESGSEKE